MNSLYLLGLFCFWFLDFLVCLGRILLYSEKKKKNTEIQYYIVSLVKVPWLMQYELSRVKS